MLVCPLNVFFLLVFFYLFVFCFGSERKVVLREGRMGRGKRKREAIRGKGKEEEGKRETEGR